MKGDFVIPKRYVERIDKFLFTDESMWWWVGFFVYFIAICVVLMALVPIMGYYDLQSNGIISKLWVIWTPAIRLSLAGVEFSLVFPDIWWQPTLTFLSALLLTIKVFIIYAFIGQICSIVSLFRNDNEGYL